MYVRDEAEYTVKDFISKHQTRFPILAVVSQGYLGNSESDTFATGQVLRLHFVDRIPRIIGRIADDQHGRFDKIKALSFPLNHDSSILVSTNKGKRKSLRDIVQKGKLPCHVNVCENYYIHQNDKVLQLDQSVSVVLERRHELQCILGNPVSGVELLDHVVVIPEYLHHIRLAAVTGIEGFNTVYWQQLQRYMSDVVDKYIHFEHSSAIKEIVAFWGDFKKTDHFQNYESLQFTSVLKDSSQPKYERLNVSQSPLQNDEPVYSIIPDKTYEYLTVQSNEWKRKLNIKGENTTPNKLNTRPEVTEMTNALINPPPLAERKNIGSTEVPPKLPVRPVKPETSITKVKSPSMTLDMKKRATVQPFDTERNKHVSEDDMIKEKLQTGSLSTLDNMTIADIGRILQELHLDSYVKKFADSYIDGMILKEFNMDVLKELGFTHVEAIRLLKYIQCGHVPK